MKKIIKYILIAGIYISSLCIIHFGIASPKVYQTERYQIIYLFFSLVLLGIVSVWAFWKYAIKVLFDKGTSKKKKKVIVFIIITVICIVASWVLLDEFLTEKLFDRSEVIGNYISNFHEYGFIKLREDGTYVVQHTEGDGEVISRNGSWELKNFNGKSEVYFNEAVVYIQGLPYGISSAYIEKPFWGKIRLVFGVDEGFYYIKRN